MGVYSWMNIVVETLTREDEEDSSCTLIIV